LRGDVARSDVNREQSSPRRLIARHVGFGIPEPVYAVVAGAAEPLAIIALHHYIETAEIHRIDEQKAQVGIERRRVPVSAPDRTGEDHAGHGRGVGEWPTRVQSSRDA